MTYDNELELGGGWTIDATMLARIYPNRYGTIIADLTEATKRILYVSDDRKAYCECLRDGLIHCFVITFNDCLSVQDIAEKTVELPSGKWERT